MQRPIRLNRTFVRNTWPSLDRGSPDPRILLDADIDEQDAASIIARIKIDGVFKTTSPNRFPETTRQLAALQFKSPPVVLDVGASDGSASLSVIEAMDFVRYYVTDRHIDAHACLTRKGVFFCDADFVPFMFANRFFVVYNDVGDASRTQAVLVRGLFSGFDRSKCREVRKVVLMNRALLPKLGSSIRLERYSIFDAWPLEEADLVIAANILNRGYFPDSKLQQALWNLRNALTRGGRLAVIENRHVERSINEQSNIFRLDNGRFVAEEQVGGGCDIKSLVTGLA